MLLSLLMAATAALPQPANTSAATAAPRPTPGKFFLSPMGEPFYGRVPGEDGLVVWFEQADRNHDGALTVEEMVADADRFFAVLDRQHDGEIDPDDVAYYEAVMVPQLRFSNTVTESNIEGEAVQYSDLEAAAGQFGLLKIPQPITSADLNFDRGVSPEEFRAAAVKRFGMLDVAGSGRLTLPALQEVRIAAGAASKRKHAPTKAADFGNNLTPQ